VPYKSFLLNDNRFEDLTLIIMIITRIKN